MGSEESRSDESQLGSGETSNVVRIPRDWFGPADELVPFGPRADHSGVAGALSTGGSEDAPEFPLDPNSFWGEEATSIHDVVDSPIADQEQPPGLHVETERRRFGRVHLSLGVGSAAIGVALLVGLGAIAPLALTGSKPRVGRHVVASVVHHESAREASSPLVKSRREPARAKPRRMHARGRTSHRSHNAVATSRPQPTQVVYHPSQPTYSPSPGPSYSGTSSETAADGAGSAGSGAAGAATTSSATHSSQPAFGANGALGPMSSPDG